MKKSFFLSPNLQSGDVLVIEFVLDIAKCKGRFAHTAFPE